MEGTIGEIRLFASSFAPKNWAYCQGQTINIASNTALFSILGITYGGNGTTTFQLPNLVGRSALGAGQGVGLSNYNLGAVAGTESVTLTADQIPMHAHGVTIQSGTGGGATATLNAVNAPGTVSTPGGNYLAQDSGGGSTSYAPVGTPVAMQTGSVAVTSVNAPLPLVNIGVSGGNIAHNNLQPLLGLNYIICTIGMFPARD